MHVKICGLTNLADARTALRAGADLLGFNFYRPSPRYVEPAAAAQIIATLRAESGLTPRSKPKAARAAERGPARRILITGGAGFLGVNAAVRMIEEGWHVTLLDNLSRPGTERNLRWLIDEHPAEITFIRPECVCFVLEAELCS